MKNRRHAWPRIPIMYVVIVLAAMLGFSYYASSDDESTLAPEALAPASAGIAGAEESFQSLPASAPAPGSLKIPIFIYHSVRPHIAGEDAMNEAYDITPDLLDQELEYLEKNGYTTISMDQFAAYVSQGYSPALKPVVLTFDDGWRNEYQYAFPLLEKHHMTATFFIYTNPIDHQKPHFLSWDEVREMDKAGMEIGDHTVTHPLFPRLTQAEIRAEMENGKTRIEQELGHPIRHFASPFGSTSAFIEATAKELGFTSARTTYRGVYHTKDDLFRLRGILVDDRLADFVKVLNTN